MIVSLNEIKDSKALSYSAIKAYLTNTLQFKNRVTEEKDYFDFGKLLDFLCTSNESVYKYFYVGENKIVKGSTGSYKDQFLSQFESNIELFYNFETDELIEKGLKDLYSAVGFKRDSFDKVIETLEYDMKVIVDAKKAGKIRISNTDLYLASALAKTLKKHPFSRDCFLKSSKDIEIKYQVCLIEENCKLDSNIDILQDLKGIIDILIINHKEKTIRIIDLKHIGKGSVYTFANSFKTFNYDIQGAIYYTLVKNHFKDYNYKILMEFLAVDKTLSNPPLRFIMTDTMILDTLGFITSIVDNINKSKNLDNFETYPKIIENNGAILLDRPLNDYIYSGPTSPIIY